MSVCLTEKEAREAGYDYMANELPVANMPRAHVNNDLKGLFKVIVDKKSKLVLGATLLAAIQKSQPDCHGHG